VNEASKTWWQKRRFKHIISSFLAYADIKILMNIFGKAHFSLSSLTLINSQI